MIQLILAIIGFVMVNFLTFVLGALGASYWIAKKVYEDMGKEELDKFVDFVKRD